MISSTTFPSRVNHIQNLAQFNIFMETLSRQRENEDTDLDELTLELFRFLFLRTSYLVSPSLRTDMAWHTLLLLPRLYTQICKILLSSTDATLWTEDGIIDHDPLGGDNKYAQHQRYALLLTKYKDVFGKAAPEQYWPP